MKKIILLTQVLFLCVMTHQAVGQVYRTGWDNSSEQSGWTEYELGVMSATNDWSFEPNTPISSPNSAMHYYPVGGTNVTDDWLVSPMFDFSNGGQIDSLSYRFFGFGTPQTGDTIALYLLNGSPDPNLATSKQQLKLYTDATYQNDNTWRTDVNLNIPATSGSSYLAIRYKTIVNWLDAAFDNLKVTANFNTSSQSFKNEYHRIELYPNPAHNLIRIKQNGQLGSITKVTVRDVAGRRVYSSTNNDAIDLSTLPIGLYFARIETSKKLIFSKKIIKE